MSKQIEDWESRDATAWRGLTAATTPVAATTATADTTPSTPAVSADAGTPAPVTPAAFNVKEHLAQHNDIKHECPLAQNFIEALLEAPYHEPNARLLVRHTAQFQLDCAGAIVDIPFISGVYCVGVYIKVDKPEILPKVNCVQILSHKSEDFVVGNRPTGGIVTYIPLDYAVRLGQRRQQLIIPHAIHIHRVVLALEIRVQELDLELIKMVIAAGYQPSTFQQLLQYDNTAMSTAAQHGATNIIKRILDKTARSEQLPLIESALHAAVVSGQVEVVRQLINSVQPHSTFMEKLLMLAMTHNNVKLVTLIVTRQLLAGSC